MQTVCERTAADVRRDPLLAPQFPTGWLRGLMLAIKHISLSD